MTKFYTFLFSLAAFSFGLQAQVEIHMDDDPGVNYNGQTVALNIAYSQHTIYMHCVNASGSDIDMKFRRVILSSSATMTDQFCDNYLCYPTSGNDWTTPASNTIAAGDSSLMKPLLDFSAGGDIHLRYYVLDVSDNKLDSVDFTISNTLSVDEVDIAFSSYPNPANDNFYINFQGNEGVNFGLVIYNVVGEEVMRKSLSNGTNKINVDALNNGVYFYSIVTNDDVIETKKLVIRH